MKTTKAILEEWNKLEGDEMEKLDWLFDRLWLALNERDKLKKEVDGWKKRAKA